MSDQQPPSSSGTTPPSPFPPQGDNGGDSSTPPQQFGEDTNAAGAQDATPKPKGPLGTGQLSGRSQHLFVIPAHPNTQFDDAEFLTLLEGSISLTYEEKVNVIEAIPRLEQKQIDELFVIFREEKQKFSELESEFSDDVSKLKKEREDEIARVEIRQEEDSESQSDEQKAEEIRKQFGL